MALCPGSGISRRSAALTGLAFCAALIPGFPAYAHHSFAEFDDAKVITVTGIAESMQWSNPHVRVTMRVQTGAARPPQVWTLITSNPSILRRFGWTRESIHPGDPLQAQCNPKRDGTTGGRLVTLLDLQSGTTLRTKLSAAGKPP